MRPMSIMVPLAAAAWAVLGPLPLAAQEATRGSPAPDAGRALVSWTSDRHQLREGDLVTILVDEHLLATAQKDESASQRRDRDLGLSALLPGTNTGGDLRTQNDVSDRARGEASRTQRFSGEISARAIEVSASGLIRIEGTRKMQIDEVEESLTIRGWIRPQDLSLSNTVESWRISDAEILLTSNGKLGEQRGFWSKLLNWIWP